MSEATILQAAREKEEAMEFITIFKTLTEREKGRVQGYMECLRTVEIPKDGNSTAVV